MAVLFLPGGGAVEAGLSIYLENFATSLGSREQLAIAEFADALLVIPKTLAVNAAKVNGGWQHSLCEGLYAWVGGGALQLAVNSQ
jgi:chaperonin GroEL (HSP60 family)